MTYLELAVSVNSKDEVKVEFGAGGRLVFRGLLDEENAEAVERRVKEVDPGSVNEVDFDELEVRDGRGAVAAVNAIRMLLARRETPLVVHNAPQIIGHNLYRTGLLESGRQIRLVRMREDEAYG